jgi:orotate phosphoribosyltransferase
VSICVREWCLLSTQNEAAAVPEPFCINPREGVVFLIDTERFGAGPVSLVGESSAPGYHAGVTRDALIEHLVTNALRTDGPFTLRSGEEAEWYLDARQTTFAGSGAPLVGEAILEVLDPEVDAVGGMTLGADPVAMATAMVAASHGRDLRAFSIRKEEKDHGIGGRLVGPVEPGMQVAMIDDTTTTGSAAGEATDVALEAGLEVVQAIVLVDRSDGLALERFHERGIPFVAIVTPADLGVGA